MSLRLACLFILSSGLSFAGINWKSVWLEPRIPVVLIAVDETRPFTVMGLNGADTIAELTKSPYLKISSSDTGILEIDPASGTFIGKRPGHVDIRISFSEAAEMVPAFVRAKKTNAAVAQSGYWMDGVWRAVFTGDWGERPKMVSEIVFALDSSGDALTGTVHAAYWPGDAAVTDGKVDRDRVTFTMTGHLPFQAGRPGAMVTGYPKLCFTCVRDGNDMKIDLLWTEARSGCAEGKLLPMAAKKVAD